METAQVVALAMVFITNALMLLGLGWLLWRTHCEHELMRALMQTGTQDLVEAGRSLRGLGGGVDRLLERMGAAERQSTAMLRVTADSVAAMDSQLRQTLETTLNELAANGELGDTDLHRDVRQLIDSLKDVAPGAVGGWAQNHQAELDQVMAQSELLMSENERLQGQVGDLREQLLNLQSVQRAQQAATREIEVLRRSLDQQQQLNGRLRNELREAEHRSGGFEIDARQTRSEIEQLQHDGERQAEQLRQADERLRAAQAELAEAQTQLQAERDAQARLQAELAKQKDQLQRLQVEKDFIEDKYMGLDEEVPVTP